MNNNDSVRILIQPSFVTMHGASKVHVKNKTRHFIRSRLWLVSQLHQRFMSCIESICLCWRCSECKRCRIKLFSAWHKSRFSFENNKWTQNTSFRRQRFAWFCERLHISNAHILFNIPFKVSLCWSIFSSNNSSSFETKTELDLYIQVWIVRNI